MSEWIQIRKDLQYWDFFLFELGDMEYFFNVCLLIILRGKF